LNGRHQGKIEPAALRCVPESLVNIAQIQTIGLESVMPLHGQDAEKNGEGENQQEANY
jgi:hypothetical protein